ncbi:MAG TPA: hypothetical protein VFM19_07130 [Candidatus Limnocylindria bacterium]|nr:hypothetical protein [Candidatus Limnocylindria bacterium]
MLDYRIHYAILANEDRLRDVSRGRLVRLARGKRVVHATDDRPAARATRR